jgi:hypothetical protein
MPCPEHWARVDYAFWRAAASWALGARAQQAAVPVVGFLTRLSRTYNERYAPAFLQGLQLQQRADEVIE